MLRSLVVQLEEELVALKEKVRTSDEQLAALQNAQESLVKGNDALTLFLQGKDVQDVLTQLDDKVTEEIFYIQMVSDFRNLVFLADLATDGSKWIGS